MLFIKRLDELQTLAERKASRSGKFIESPNFSKNQRNLRWSSFKDPAADQMFATVCDDAPSLAWFVKSMVGMDRTAAQTAFTDFLNDRSLNAQQMRFVEMVIDQLTARGVMKKSELYEAPFSQLHAGGPDELFTGKETVVDSLYATLGVMHSGLSSAANR